MVVNSYKSGFPPGNYFITKNISFKNPKMSLVNLHYIPYLFSENRPEEQAFEVNKTLNEKISLWQGDITKLEIDAIVNAGKVILFYHINYGVKQGFPALRKALTLHMKKYCIFSLVLDIINQLLKSHLPFVPLIQVDECTVKPSLSTSQGCLLGFFWIMVVKTLKNPYHLQIVTLKLF